jgi:hypothetical protein
MDLLLQTSCGPGLLFKIKIDGVQVAEQYTDTTGWDG